MITAAVLCGGLGTRIASISGGRPKSMIPINGRPFIGYQLDLLKRRGVERVVLCTGYGAPYIKAYVGTGIDWGLIVDYSHSDRLALPGTAGALRDALPIIGDDPFLVVYGDVYLDIDYLALFRAFEFADALGMVAMCDNRGGREPSNIARAGGFTIRYDKRDPDSEMDYLDAGAAVYRASVFAVLDQNTPVDLGDVMYELSRRGVFREGGRLWGWPTYHKPHEVGSHDGIVEFEERVSRSDFPK